MKLVPFTAHTFVIDFKNGFTPTNDNIYFYARKYWESTFGLVHPDGGGCPVVT